MRLELSRRPTFVLFVAGALGLGALLLWAFAGLPDFGHYTGPYGDVLNATEAGERHGSNVVTAIVFDYRGLDTMGEELILFAAATGTALLLRLETAQDVGSPLDRFESDGVRAVGLAAVGITLLLGVDVVAHGYLTPGGGFQGGVLLAAGAVLVFLAAEWRAYRHAFPKHAADVVEGVGAGGFVLLGIAGLALGYGFLGNFLPLGEQGELISTGSIPLVNWSAAIEVAAAFSVVFTEFLEEVELLRHGGDE